MGFLDKTLKALGVSKNASLNVLSIVVNRPEKHYKNGDRITGWVLVETQFSERVKAVHIRLVGSEHTEVYVAKTRYTKDQTLSLTSKRLVSEEVRIVPDIKYAFPFDLKVPEDWKLASCFMEAEKNVCQVKHMLHAEVEFVDRKPCSAFETVFLHPKPNYAGESEDKKVLEKKALKSRFLFFGKQGLKAKLDYSTYKPTEDVKLDVEFVNLGDVKEVYLTFKRLWTFKADGHKAFLTEILTNQKVNYAALGMLTVSVPISATVSSFAGEFVQMQYVVEIDTKKAKLELPLLIQSMPEIGEDDEESKFFGDNNNNKNNNADNNALEKGKLYYSGVCWPIDVDPVHYNDNSQRMKLKDAFRPVDAEIKVVQRDWKPKQEVYVKTRF